MPSEHRLLVVDDDPGVTALIGEIASDAGFEVSQLSDSSKFFDRFAEFDPDILCVDIHMPDIDGIEIMRWLSRQECRANVIVLSGGDPLFTTVAERIGCSAKIRIKTLGKPFQVHDVRAALDFCIGARDSVGDGA